MPLSCSAMRAIHLSIPLPYGGLHHTKPCQGDVKPSSAIVSARSSGTHVLSKPGEHTSRSKPTPSASNTDLGVYHSTLLPTAASWTKPDMILLPTMSNQATHQRSLILIKRLEIPKCLAQ